MASIYDQNIANQAAAVDQCVKLGGVILKPKAAPAGFGAPTAPPQPLGRERDG